MDGFGLLAGLLGGYQQGRQLRQNRDIKKAQIERQVVQDAYTRAHQTKMEGIAQRRLTLAENPVRNLDPAAGTNFDRSIADINKYYQDWHARLAKAGPLADKRAILNEGIDALPGFRTRIQSNIDQWGKDIGYEGADPDMFLQPMHGMRTKYDPTKGNYSYVDDNEFRRTYAPKAISDADMGYVRSQIDAIRKTISNPEQQRAAMTAVKQGLIDKYGEDAANAAIPYLPLDEIKIGSYQGFAPKTQGYVPYTPEAGFQLPPDINPATGISTDTSRIRKVIDPAKLATQFGADAPGRFAPQAEKDAYQDARYNAPQNLGTFRPVNFNPTQGKFNIAPTFQPSPINSNPADFADPDKEFNRAYMTRIMSGPAAGKTEEEVGLGTLVQMFQRQDPNFNPFKNVDDARKILSLVGPQDADVFHKVVARVANEGGYERQEGETKALPLTSKYELTPYESTNAADAAGKLSDQRVTESRTLLPLKEADIKSRITERVNQERERRWRRYFDTIKFDDTKKRGWAQIGISQGNLNLNNLRRIFNEKITMHRVTNEDVKLVQGLYKHMDGEQKSLQLRLKAVETSITAANASINLNGGSLSHLSGEERQQLIDGTMPAAVRKAKITGTNQANAAAALEQLGVMQKERSDINAQLEATSADVLEAKTWEENMRDQTKGNTFQRDADVKLLMEQNGWTEAQAQHKWESGSRPKSASPGKGKSTGKPQGKPKAGGMPEGNPL
jgi:hypothetical protein